MRITVPWLLYFSSLTRRRRKVSRTSADFHALSFSCPQTLFRGTDLQHFCSMAVFSRLPQTVLGTLFNLVAPILEGSTVKSQRYGFPRILCEPHNQKEVFTLSHRFGGKSRIRTHGRLFTASGFLDRCHQPLGHLPIFASSN